MYNLASPVKFLKLLKTLVPRRHENHGMWGINLLGKTIDYLFLEWQLLFDKIIKAIYMLINSVIK